VTDKWQTENDLARVYSLCSELVERDQSLALEEQLAKSDEFAKQAVIRLHRILNFPNINKSEFRQYLESYPDFDPLRSRADRTLGNASFRRASIASLDAAGEDVQRDQVAFGDGLNYLPNKLSPKLGYFD
jgi:hypothetical protein